MEGESQERCEQRESSQPNTDSYTMTVTVLSTIIPLKAQSFSYFFKRKQHKIHVTVMICFPGRSTLNKYTPKKKRDESALETN